MSIQAKQIPAGWKMAQISDICKILSGSTPKTSESEYWDGSIPWFTPLDLSEIRSRYVKASDRKITEEGFNSCSAQKIPPRSLIMSSRAPIGYFAINLEEATTNQGCKSFICSEVINVDFLYYYLNQNIDQIKRLGSGSTFAEVNKKQLESLQVIIPSKSEQTKIAAILSKVDEEIEKVERIIEQTEKLKKGLMQKLLTKGIGHTKFKQTELGEIPEEWEAVRLEEIATVERGKFSHRPRNDKRFYGGDIPFIQTGDIVNCNGKIKKYTQTLNEQGLAISRKFAKGTIVLTIAANIGDTGILTFESCFPDSLVGINVTQKMDNEFLEYYLRTRKTYLNKISTQSAQKNINLEKLRPLLIIKPSKYEQQEIARILNSLETKISNIQKIKSHFLQLKKGLMNDLLSGRKRTI